MNKKNYQALNSMKNCQLIDDASIQNGRAPRGARGANSHRDPTWRSRTTHMNFVLKLLTYSLRVLGLQEINDVVFSLVLSTSLCSSGHVRREDCVCAYVRLVVCTV